MNCCHLYSFILIIYPYYIHIIHYYSIFIWIVSYLPLLKMLESWSMTGGHQGAELLMAFGKR